MNRMSGIAGIVVAIFVVGGAGAAHAQVPVNPSGGKTLRDFQREYGKPVIAWHKYQEYQRAQTPATTATEPAEVIGTRSAEAVNAADTSGVSKENASLSSFLQAYSGTKPVIGGLKYLEYRARR